MKALGSGTKGEHNTVFDWGWPEPWCVYSVQYMVYSIWCVYSLWCVYSIWCVQYLVYMECTVYGIYGLYSMVYMDCMVCMVYMECTVYGVCTVYSMFGRKITKYLVIFGSGQLYMRPLHQPTGFVGQVCGHYFAARCCEPQLCCA